MATLSATISTIGTILDIVKILQAFS